MGEYMGAVPFVLKMTSFVEKLSAEALAHFNDVTQKPFSQQAVAFLNAYWPEVHDQAEFIFTVAWEVMKYADMHAKGIQLIFQYEEGNDLDFDIGLYFYEQLCKFVEQPKNAQWADAKFARSQPTMMTAIKRKQEIRKRLMLILMEESECLNIFCTNTRILLTLLIFVKDLWVVVKNIQKSEKLDWLLKKSVKELELMKLKKQD